AERAHEQVRALAAIGRVGRGGLPAEPVSLEEVSREAIAEVNLLFSNRSIEYHLEPSLPIFRLPRVPLQQVLVQLLRNAIQAGGDSPHLRIEMGGRRTPESQEFWVADRGRGLSAEEQRQLEESLTGQGTSAPGNGLGLVLVRQIVDSWGGSL